MQYFTIRQLEQFSGIKPATLRMWEKRYGVLASMRAAGTIRKYTLGELRYLLDLALLNRNGMRISRLAALDHVSLATALRKLVTPEHLMAQALNRLIVAMYDSNIEEFERILDQVIRAHGQTVAMEQLVFPFLNRVQLLSYRDQRAEVHFVVPAVRKKIINAIECLKTPSPGSPSALLFLPEKEHFDLILLYLNYQIKAAQRTVFYLGTDINTTNLMKVLEQKKPDYVVTYLVRSVGFPMAAYGRWLQEHLPGTLLLITQEKDTVAGPPPPPPIVFLAPKDIKFFFTSQSR